MGILGVLVILLLVLWLLGHLSLTAVLLAVVVILLLGVPTGSYTRRGWW